MKKFYSLLMLFAIACNQPNTPPVPQPGPAEGEQVFATGYIKPENKEFGNLHYIPRTLQGEIPESFSYEDQGFKVPMRDQKNCGSCWAFASTGTLEMALKVFTQKDYDLSERELVANLYYGCNGGFGAGEFQTTHGQTSEEQCKYSESYDRKCPNAKPVAKALAWGYVGKPNRSPSVVEVQKTIMAYGSVWGTVCANSAFMNYHGGLSSKGPKCQTNHMVGAVGWKTVNGKVYFKLKNSWNTKWGEEGYGWFELGSYNFLEEAGWTSVEATPCKPPALKIPKKYEVAAGDEVVIAVKNLANVSYTWFEGQTKLGEGNELVVTPSKDTVYRVVVKSNCGEGEMQTQVILK